MSDDLDALIDEAEEEISGDAPGVAAGPGAAASFIHGGVEAIPLGQRIAGALTSGVLKTGQAVGRALPPGVGAAVPLSGGLFDPRLGPELDASLLGNIEREQEQARLGAKAHPLASRLGGLTSTAALLAGGVKALPKLPSFSALPALTPAQQLVAGGMDAAAVAALLGATRYPETPLRGAVQGMSDPLNIALGAGMPALAQAMPGGIRGIARGAGEKLAGLVTKIRGPVVPSEAAKKLIGEGVSGLTIGQMAPKSAAAQLEEIATSTPIAGPALVAQREIPLEQFRGAVVGKAVPPGGAKPTGSVPEMLDELKGQFDRAYSGVSGTVRPVISTAEAEIPLAKALEDAVGDPGLLVSDATRSQVAKWLKNQMSIIEKGASRAGGVDVGRLLKVRSNIRDNWSRSRLGGTREGDAEALLLEQAEDAVTAAMESQLPAEMMAQLRDIDRNYAIYKTVVNAQAKAPLGQEFSPAQLGMAVKASAGKERTALGRAGALQEIAGAGQEVFGQRVPVTGARLLGLLPGGKAVHGLVGLGMNRPDIRQILMGRTPVRLPGPPAPMAGAPAGAAIINQLTKNEQAAADSYREEFGGEP